jgi:hypothetical protein
MRQAARLGSMFIASIALSFLTRNDEIAISLFPESPTVMLVDQPLAFAVWRYVN